MKEETIKLRNPTLPTSRIKSLVSEEFSHVSIYSVMNECIVPPAPSIPPEPKSDNYKTIMSCSSHLVTDGGNFDPIFFANNFLVLY